MLTASRKRHSRWCLGVLVIFAIACYGERIINPIGAPATPLRSVNDPPPPPQSITVDIPIPPTNLGGAGVSISPIPIQPYQPYMVTVSGRVNVASNPAAAACGVGSGPFGAEGSYGPGGTGGAWGSLRVSATGVPVDDGGAGGASEAKSDTLAGYSYPTQVEATRSRLIRECNDQVPTTYGMYLLSGSQTLTVTFLDGIELNLDPKAVLVKKGDKVTFTARSRGTIVGGPIWQFTKSDSLPDQTSRCSTNPCEVTVMNSGTLRATAWLYGRWRSDAAAIRVYSGFTLDADKSMVKYGDTVTFTPKLDGVPARADRWRWVPDSVRPGDATYCEANAAECKKRMVRKGVMWAYSGQDSARADVAVDPPCRGDYLAATLKFQKRQDTLWSTANQLNKESVSAWYMDSTTNDIVELIVPLTYADNCFSKWNAGSLIQPGYLLIGVSHVHPSSRQREPIPYCGGKNYDPSREYDMSKRGGGSRDDWIAVRSANQTFKQQIPNHPDVPFYIVDGMNLYRLDPSTPSGREEPERKQWTRPGYSCQ